MRTLTREELAAREAKAKRTITERARWLLEDGYTFRPVEGVQGRFLCVTPEAEHHKRQQRRMALYYTLDSWRDPEDADIINVTCDCQAYSQFHNCKHSARLWHELRLALPIALHFLGCTGNNCSGFSRAEFSG